jgi:hypothetical protein
MLPKSWSVTMITTNCTKPFKAIGVRVERVMAVRSSNLVKGNVWEINNTVTMVEMMNTRTIILFKNIHKYIMCSVPKLITFWSHSVMVSDIKVNLKSSKISKWYKRPQQWHSLVYIHTLASMQANLARLNNVRLVPKSSAPNTFSGTCWISWHPTQSSHNGSP